MQHKFSFWAVALVLLLAPLALHAQDTVTGAFEGAVTDNRTGAPVADANVEIVSPATGLIFFKTTNARGRFYQGLLIPGLYTIRVSADGYQTREVEQRLFVTRTGEVVPVPVALEPANAPQTAAVPTPTPLTARETDVLAETNRADAGRAGSFPDGVVDKLPLGGTTLTRTFDELPLLLPGVTLPPPSIGNGAGPGQGAGVGTPGQFVINGLRSRANNFTVDGSDNNDEDIGVRRQGFLSLVPQSIESIREYQVTTLLPSAVFGRNLGGQVNAVSRSGGKDFHGNIYGFFNVDRLNARNFFDTTNGNDTRPVPSGRTNQPVITAPQLTFDPITRNFRPVNGQLLTATNGSGGKDSFTFGQHGLTLGGPVWRERSFFFVSYERQFIHATQEASFAVPVVEQRGVARSGASGLFRNPMSGSPTFAHPATLPGDAIFSLYPHPNNPAGVYGPNTYTQTLPARGAGAIASAKYDQTWTWGGRQQSLTGRYNFTQDRRILPVTGGALFSSLEPRVRVQNFSFFYNSEVNRPTDGPQILNQLRLSYGRTRLNFGEVADRTGFILPAGRFADTPFLLNARLTENFTLPMLSADGSIVANTGPVILRRRPGATVADILGPVGQVRLAGYSPVGVDVFNFPQRRVNNTYQLADTVTLRTGGHTFALGYDGRRTELNSDLQRNFRPLITFNGSTEARLTPQGAEFSGGFVPALDLAAAAAPSGVQQTLIASSDAALNLRFYQHNFFFQDDWKPQRNLSFSFGLRYEYNTPPSDSQRRLEGSFNDPNLNLVPGLSTFTGQRRQPYQPDFNNFAPRVGLAYSPHEDSPWVFRAGYGIFYDQILGAVVSQSRSVFPRFVNVNAAGGMNRPLPGLTTLGIFNPALNSILVQPGTLNTLNPNFTLAQQIQEINRIASNGGALPPVSGIEFTLPAPNLPSPFSQQVSAGFEVQATTNLALSAAFVGTSGHNLLRFSTPNLGPNAILLPLIFRTPQTPEGISFAPEFLGLALPPGARLLNGNANGARPLPGVGGASIFETAGGSFYRSLQVQARGRARALRFQAAYTLGRVTDDVSDAFDLAGAFALPQNSLTRAGERAPANFDTRHRVAYYFIYEILPSQENAFLRAVLGHLEISGTGQFQTGTPFTVNSIHDVNLDGNLTDRLNTTQGLLVTGDRRQPLRLTLPANRLLASVGQDGAIGRNSFRTGSLLDSNLALTKNWIFTENRRLAVRVEVFNVINRANFGVPVRLLEASGFGQAVNTLTPGRRVQLVMRYGF